MLLPVFPNSVWKKKSVALPTDCKFCPFKNSRAPLSLQPTLRLAFIAYSFIELPWNLSTTSINSHRKASSSLVQRFWGESPFIFTLRAWIQHVWLHTTSTAPFCLLPCKVWEGKSYFSKGASSNLILSQHFKEHVLVLSSFMYIYLQVRYQLPIQTVFNHTEEYLCSAKLASATGLQRWAPNFILETEVGAQFHTESCWQ